jgi:hypothetical protein
LLRIVFSFFKQNYLHLVGLHIVLCMHWQQPFHNLKPICQQSNVYQMDNYSLQSVFIRDVNWRMKSCSDQTEYFRYTTLLFYWRQMYSGNIIIFHTYEFKINSLHSLTSHDSSYHFWHTSIWNNKLQFQNSKYDNSILLVWCQPNITFYYNMLYLRIGTL